MIKVFLILSIAPAFGFNPPVERHIREVPSLEACVTLGSAFLREHRPTDINARALAFSCEVQDAARAT